MPQIFWRISGTPRTARDESSVAGRYIYTVLSSTVQPYIQYILHLYSSYGINPFTSVQARNVKNPRVHVHAQNDHCSTNPGMRYNLAIPGILCFHQTFLVSSHGLESEYLLSQQQ